MNFNIHEFLKIIYEGEVFQEGMQIVTWKYNCITNIQNNLTKGGGGEGAEESSFGNKQNL